MHKWFGLLACLSFSVALIGCEKPADHKVDKAANQMNKDIAEEAKAEEKAVDEMAKDEKADINEAKKEAQDDVNAAAKEVKEEDDDTK